MPMFADKPLPVFAAMRDVRWRRIEENYGEVLYRAKLLRTARSRFGVVEARAELGGHTLCSGELTFTFIDEQMNK